MYEEHPAASGLQGTWAWSLGQSRQGPKPPNHPVTYGFPDGFKVTIVHQARRLVDFKESKKV